VDDLLATKSEDVGLIVRTISLQDFQRMWSWSTNVTDDMQPQGRALHYSALHSRNPTEGKQQTKNCLHMCMTVMQSREQF